MPAGMIHVAIAATTIRANRIVYAEGRVNRPFGSGSTDKREKILLVRGLGTVDPRIELVKGERFYRELTLDLLA